MINDEWGIQMRVGIFCFVALCGSVALAANTAAAAEKISSKESYQRMYCDKFERAADSVDVETLIEEIENSHYAANELEFWTAPACEASQKLSSKVPILFNTATDVVRSENFPKTVREYYLEVRKDTSIWPMIISAKSSEGMTILDYMYYCISTNKYIMQESKDAAARIVDYLCKTGGVYSVYKDKAKCQ